MAEKKAQPIIIKKGKGDGHGGHHGGAWKVAYADFVTAMMCFFLVMWLMGSDEEIRAAVAEYFNNPSSVWQPELMSKENLPLGDNAGPGASVVKGEKGAVPDDLVQRPARPFRLHTQEGQDDGDTIDPLVAGRDVMDIDTLKFSIPLSLLFKPGTQELAANAPKVMEKIGKLTRNYRGFISISSDPVLVDGASGAAQDPYEFAVARSVTLANFLVQNHWADEEKVKTNVRRKTDPERHPAADDEVAPNRKRTPEPPSAEFLMSLRKPGS